MTRVTIKQIAEEAGVSMTTVSNVLNKKAHRVSKEKIQLIEEIIEKHNYIPNMNARSLVNSSSKLIGVLYYSEEGNFIFSDPFTSELLAGIEKESKKNGYFVLVHNVTSIEDVLTLQKNWNFDGFIMVGVSARVFSTVNKVVKKPIVYIDTYILEKDKEQVMLEKNSLFVNTNDYSASMSAMEHLISYGHHNIAFLSFDFAKNLPSVIEKRYQAYGASLKNRGIQENPELFYVETEFDKIHQSLSKFSAILVSSDYLAAKLVKYLKNRKSYCVEQTSIISFDDIYFSELMDPGLSTIRLSPSQKGKIAFIELLKLATGKIIESQFILLEGELISRESVFNINEQKNEV